MGLRSRRLFLVLALLLAAPAAAAEPEEGRDWAVTAFGAFQLRGDIWQNFYAPDFNTDYRFLALALSRRFYRVNQHLDLALEGQAIKHVAGQYHEEFNALLVARWRTFPWSQRLPTTFAIGNGISYATETPDWEKSLHGRAAQWLDCMLFELTFSLPQQPRWALVWRVHHRSGVYRFFGDIEGASTAMGWGLQYRF